MEWELPEKAQMGRREFIGAAAVALFAGIAIQIAGCGSNDNGTGGGTIANGDVSGSISGNHGHVATVTKAQLDAGGAVNLDIRGTADHTHIVALTAQDLASIKVGTQVVATSSTTSSHNHTITFN